MNTPNTAISVRLPDPIVARLNTLASKTGRSKTYYIREAIFEHLENLEDLYDAEQEYRELKAGKDTSIPLKDILKQYDLDS